MAKHRHILQGLLEKGIKSDGKRIPKKKIYMSKEESIISSDVPTSSALVEASKEATPATQVSVERFFSALNYILNEKRSYLTLKNLYSLLVVKLN